MAENATERPEAEEFDYPNAVDFVSKITTPRHKTIIIEWYGERIPIKIRNVSVTARAAIDEQAALMQRTKKIPIEVGEKLRWIIAALVNPPVTVEQLGDLYKADSTVIDELVERIKEHSYRMEPWDWGAVLGDLTDAAVEAVLQVQNEHGVSIQGDMPDEVSQVANKDYREALRDSMLYFAQGAMERGRVQYRLGVEGDEATEGNAKDADLKKDLKLTTRKADGEEDSGKSVSTDSKDSPAKS
jgi:hypothetical protein